MTDDNEYPQRRKPSFEKIAYNLRPAKSIERKMLVEALQRLSAFEHLASYQYVGFGSTYFSDFSLFHKSLGMTRMISIEQEDDQNLKKRVQFNRPYKCIDIKFGRSTITLPKLSWEARTILWLDYDDKLNSYMLSDLKYACTNMRSGSIIIISVNAHPDEYKCDRLAELRKRAGETKVPIDISKKDLAGWGTAKVYHRIITNEITEIVDIRNKGLTFEERLAFKQLFNFHYQDGARILTVGGLLFAQKEAELAAKCAFEQLGFIRESTTDCLIEVPCLTYRELRYLDRQLPNDVNVTHLDWLPDDDVQKYAQVYRYFPLFAETEL